MCEDQGTSRSRKIFSSSRLDFDRGTGRIVEITRLWLHHSTELHRRLQVQGQSTAENINVRSNHVLAALQESRMAIRRPSEWSRLLEVVVQWNECLDRHTQSTQSKAVRCFLHSEIDVDQRQQWSPASSCSSSWFVDASSHRRATGIRIEWNQK